MAMPVTVIRDLVPNVNVARRRWVGAQSQETGKGEMTLLIESAALPQAEELTDPVPGVGGPPGIRGSPS